MILADRADQCRRGREKAISVETGRSPPPQEAAHAAHGENGTCWTCVESNCDHAL
jgi:hypothetical protein